MQSVHFETQAKMYTGGIKGPGFSLEAIIGSTTGTDAKTHNVSKFVSVWSLNEGKQLKANIRQIEQLFCVRCCVWEMNTPSSFQHNSESDRSLCLAWHTKKSRNTDYAFAASAGHHIGTSLLSNIMGLEID